MRAMFPMHWSWRLALALLPLAGGAALVAALLELSGAVARGTLLGEAGDAERWVAVAFGALAAPFGVSALRHARLSIDDVGLHHLGFGLLCSTRTVAFTDVNRWGHAVTSNRGRREPHLLFELHSGDERLVKLAMYTGQQRILAALSQRLGPPAPAEATIAGVRFRQR